MPRLDDLLTLHSCAERDLARHAQEPAFVRYGQADCILVHYLTPPVGSLL
ncbi:hypothetical protein [Amycolatopsis sp. NPDC051903]